MSADQKNLYTSITGGPRAQGPQHFALVRSDGSLTGPFNALLQSPRLGHAVQGLGAAVRYDSSLSARIREMAILIVAAHWESAFEQHAHEAVGRAIGLTEAEIAVIREGGIPPLDDETELASARLVHAAARGDVDDALWSSLDGVIDDPTRFELVTLVGYYALLALQLRIFRVEDE
jgi:4-carboxymuconolactone decarboxylase